MTDQSLIDHSQDKYYEVKQQNGMFLFHVYHYDTTGNKVITIHRSEPIYDTVEAAYDGVAEWLDDNNMDAELS